MSRCDWAGCRRTDTTPADGWLHCRLHLDEHLHLKWEEDYRARSGPKPKPREHGTQRGYDQHRSASEKPCSSCRVAHAEHERQRNLARKKAVSCPQDAPMALPDRKAS